MENLNLGGLELRDGMSEEELERALRRAEQQGASARSSSGGAPAGAPVGAPGPIAGGGGGDIGASGHSMGSLEPIPFAGAPGPLTGGFPSGAAGLHPPQYHSVPSAGSGRGSLTGGMGGEAFMGGAGGPFLTGAGPAPAAMGGMAQASASGGSGNHHQHAQSMAAQQQQGGMGGLGPSMSSQLMLDNDIGMGGGGSAGGSSVGGGSSSSAAASLPTSTAAAMGGMAGSAAGRGGMSEGGGMRGVAQRPNSAPVCASPGQIMSSSAAAAGGTGGHFITGFMERGPHLDSVTALENLQAQSMQAQSTMSGKRWPEKLYQMVNELSAKSPQVLCWTQEGDGFTINDKPEFEATYLAQYKFSTNFASFQRQLTNYDFSKDDNEYRHNESNFHRDHPERVKQVVYRSKAALASRYKKRPRSADGGGDGGGGASSMEIQALSAKIEGLEKSIGEMRGDLKTVLGLLTGGNPPT